IHGSMEEEDIDKIGTQGLEACMQARASTIDIEATLQLRRHALPDLRADSRRHRLYSIARGQAEEAAHNRLQELPQAIPRRWKNAELGDEHQAVAPPTRELSYHRFRVPPAVGARGVEDRYAAIVGRGESAKGLPATHATHQVGTAKPQGGTADAGIAQIIIAHQISPADRPRRVPQ